MFYIKPSYPDLDLNRPNQYFHSWLGKYTVKDNNYNLTFSGDYYIYSNACLPVGSYYLDFKTFFATVTNINLIYKENIMTKKINNQDAYKIDKYTFSFDLSIKNSSFFQNYILYKNIEFQIYPHINVNIFNDFKIDVDTDNLNHFMQDINSSCDSNVFNYKNAYNIESNDETINISLNNDQDYNLYINVNDFINKNEPISNLLTINKLDSSPLVINKVSIDFDYAIDNKKQSYNWTKTNLTFYNQQIQLKIDDSYILEDSTKVFAFNGKKGIYLNNCVGKISGTINFEYKNQIRTILFERDFSFNDNSTKLQKAIEINDYSNNKTLINQIQNEKIY